MWTIAAADRLANDDGFELDEHIDAEQIAADGCVHTPFRLVREHMHVVLIEEVLDDLIAMGLVVAVPQAA